MRYGGIQRPFPGTTGLKEGSIPNPKTGAVVVGQPIGAMGWYPNNDVPADKATYTTRITVPRGWSALATGVLASRRSAGHDHVRLEGDRPDVDVPRVGLGGQFDVNSLNPAKPNKTRAAAGSRNKPLPFYTAITSSLPAKGKAQSAADLGRSAEIVDFYSCYYGKRYPFTSLGGIVTLQSFGLGLETQGKPTYAITRIDSTYGPGVDLVAHELAHQFFGNLVTPARWRDAWLSDGMAVFSASVWSSTGTFFPVPPREQYLDVYANAQYPTPWRVPPRQPGAAERPLRPRRHLPPSAGHDRGDPRDPRQRHSVQGDDGPLANRTRVRRRHDRTVHRLVKRTDPTRTRGGRSSSASGSTPATRPQLPAPAGARSRSHRTTPTTSTPTPLPSG